MTDIATEVARQYGDAVGRRATVPMEPLGFEPDWSDQPARHKVYRNVDRLLLNPDLPCPTGALSGALTPGAPAAVEGGRTVFDTMSSLLGLCYGGLERRLRVNWNGRSQSAACFQDATFGRATASGGGLYPTEIYWVCGSTASVVPGVFHYDTAHHALERLSEGDITTHLRGAVLDHPRADLVDHYLVLSTRFWKNSFKYNSFSYHVVTQDAGAALGALRLVARSLGLDPFLFHWFRDEDVNAALGLDGVAESALAVLAVDPVDSREGAGPAGATGREAHLPLVASGSFERSRRVLTFPLVQEVHRAALVVDQVRPPVTDAALAAVSEPAAGEARITLGVVDDALTADLATVCLARKSAFGLFCREPALTPPELGTLLHCAAASRAYDSDLNDAGSTSSFTGLAVLVNAVAGVPAGVYAYSSTERCLTLLERCDVAPLLQRHYFLQNYNFQQVAAAIVLTGRLGAMLDVYGARGYRVLNAEVGLVAQTIYMAAAALSLGCGAILGFDNIAINAALHLDTSDEGPLLCMLVGRERSQVAEFDYRLVQCEPEERP